MPDIITISTQKPANAAFDYEALRSAGIASLEQTASAIWTDYNVHDPGITIMELLCYALTDLSYRSSYSIPDLLATENDTAKNIRQQFFSAKQIFPNRAVTINDYRKLLIDIEGVQNAWLTKRTKQVFADITNKRLSFFQPTSLKWETIDIKGFYDVLLEFDTNVDAASKIDKLTQARTLLMANRNLCEDFVNIEEVGRQEFRLCGEIEISPSADPFQSLAMIFFNIQLHLTPLIRFYKLGELQDQHYSPDKIFEGPLLSNGFIKEEELIDSELKSEIHLSDIMSKILIVDGVTNILKIIFNATDQPDKLQNKWVIDVTDGKQAIINISESNILLYINGTPFRPDLNIVAPLFEKLMSDHISANDSFSSEDISYNTGSFQNIENYYSIQNHFPKNYGISSWGLPGDAGNERIAQAKQLQGYLFFFDQQLANYFSQLAHLRNLFSFEDESHTYFTSLADGFKDAKDLFVNTVNIKKNVQDAAEKVDSDTFKQRRNLFLDHLLSRFGESFADYANILQTIFQTVDKKELINVKTRFLKNYPEYSSQRFNGYNYTGNNLWKVNTGSGTNVSGLEKRLEYLLGIKEVQRRTLVNIYSALQSSGTGSLRQFWFVLIDNRTGKLLLKANEKSPSEESALDDLDSALQRAAKIANFSLVENSTDHRFTYQLNNADKVVGISNDTYATRALAQADLNKLFSLLTTKQSDEGMFLVEQLLLFPDNKIGQTPPAGSPPTPAEIPRDGIFMPVCMDDDSGDFDTMDPYSFRMHFILPAYAPRFINIDFRRYCERTIRMEIPSHIYVKICWVGNEQLRSFENAYKDWLDVKAGVRPDPGNIIWEGFIRTLTSLKSVYPVAHLEDCSNTEERTLFLLNQNALGTFKT